ncbi:MAG: methyl-accepting chemotaxis protein [Pontibacterium sp.]
MRNFSLRRKILLLVLVPLMVATATIMAVTRAELTKKSEMEVAQTRETLMAQRRDVLKDYMDIAVSSVASVYSSTNLSTEEAQSRAKQILRDISFGKNGDGYVFVVDYQGTFQVHRAKPSLVGRNVIDLKDQNGVPLIRELINAAKANGGYVSYVWNKPSSDAPADKLSYALPLEKWGWALGTGFYIDDVEQKVAQIAQENRDLSNRIMLIIVGAGLLLLAICWAAAAWFSRSLTAPIRSTSAVLKEMSQGNGDLTRRLSIDTNDEVGELARHFNGFVEKVHALVKEVDRSISQLSSASGQMSNVVEGTKSAIEQQNGETHVVAQAINEMTSAVEQVAKSAQDAADSATSADMSAKSGVEIVQSTVSAISSLSGGVRRSSKVISQLYDDADKIGAVINVIKDIADQTNLLALNAAIEAARAGEQGRGFSVVADEVRSLANRTQQSTNEIQSMIETIQRGAKQAVDVMGESQNSTDTTIELAKGTNDSLETICTAITTISSMNESIAAASTQQSSVASDVKENIDHITSIAEQAAQNADDLERTSVELEAIQKSLNSLVKQFRI